ncbi:MAG: ribonuclease HII [Candidatus Liptonbacteria bacterium]|nr:ribonuclease HII [Candidatus Liptonbacteria bacterium]
MRYIIGIDEVGRGSLAGPVTVAALALLAGGPTSKISRAPVSGGRTSKNLKLRDSKKLSPKQREVWFAYIKNHPQIFYVTAHVQPSVIDRINITKAANLAASRALHKLATSHLPPVNKKKTKIFLDGGLYARPFPKLLLANGYSLKTVIRGDEKIPAIALASIVAKVTRDKLMKRLSKKFPKYGFAFHKGYGTRAHFAAVKKFGPSSKHRLTFL